MTLSAGWSLWVGYGGTNFLLNKDGLIQYTGLKDKNGNEIYDGDIVIDKDGYKYKIEWSNDLAAFSFKGEHCNFGRFNKAGIETDETEIIGNIYENPELENEVN